MDDAVLRVALEHGALLCAFMSIIIAGSLRQDPRIWTHSGPPDVREKLGPPGPATLRRKRVWAGLMMVGLVLVFGSLARAVLAWSPEVFPGVQLALAAYVTFQVFNLYDALVVDVGLVVFKPRWAFVEGTADMPGLRSVRWHVVNYLKGVVGGVPFAALVTGAAWLLR